MTKYRESNDNIRILQEAKEVYNTWRQHAHYSSFWANKTIQDPNL